MLSGVGIICFTSSYAIAWALEISRLLFRSGVRGAIMLGFAGAGRGPYAFLYYQAVKRNGRSAVERKKLVTRGAWRWSWYMYFRALPRSTWAFPASLWRF